MTLHEKLLNIQIELKAPKSQYNAFGKYNYRNCEDILEAVKPHCAKQKVVLLLSDDIVNIGERFYVKATASLFDIDDPNQVIRVCAFAREDDEKKGMDGSQVTGSSSSYARKYALNGLFDIDDTKDADAKGKRGGKGNTNKAANTSDNNDAPVSDEQLVKAIEKVRTEVNKRVEDGVQKDAIIAALKDACGSAQYTKFTDLAKLDKAYNVVNKLSKE